MTTKEKKDQPLVKARMRQGHLKHLIDRAAGAVGRMQPYFLLEFYLSRVVCTATDLTVTIVSETSLQDGESIDMGGIVCIPAKKFAALIEALPDTHIDFALKPDHSLQVECGDYLGVVPGVDPEAHFPKVDVPCCSPDLVCDGNLIPDLFAACSHALSKKDGILSGLHLRPEKGMLVAVAVDGPRLALAGRTLEDADSVFGNGITVPARAMAELKKVCTGSLEVYIRENSITFSAPGIAISAQLLEGVYPDYRKIIPSHPHCCLVSGDELSRIVERVVVLSESDSILLDIDSAEHDGGDIRVSSSNTAGELSDLVAAEVTGDGCFIRLTPRYLLDSLHSLGKSSDDVVMKYDSDTTPVVLIPADHSGWDERVEMILPRRS